MKIPRPKPKKNPAMAKVVLFEEHEPTANATVMIIPHAKFLHEGSRQGWIGINPLGEGSAMFADEAVCAWAKKNLRGARGLFPATYKTDHAQDEWSVWFEKLADATLFKMKWL